MNTILIIILTGIASFGVYKGIRFWIHLTKETKELYDFFHLTKTQDVALDKFFKAKSPEEQESAWIDVELIQMEMDESLKHKI